MHFLADFLQAQKMWWCTKNYKYEVCSGSLWLILRDFTLWRSAAMAHFQYKKVVLFYVPSDPSEPKKRRVIWMLHKIIQIFGSWGLPQSPPRCATLSTHTICPFGVQTNLEWPKKAFFGLKRASVCLAPVTPSTSGQVSHVKICIFHFIGYTMPSFQA